MNRARDPSVAFKKQYSRLTGAATVNWHKGVGANSPFPGQACPIYGLSTDIDKQTVNDKPNPARAMQCGTGSQQRGGAASEAVSEAFKNQGTAGK